MECRGPNALATDFVRSRLRGLQFGASSKPALNPKPGPEILFKTVKACLWPTAACLGIQSPLIRWNMALGILY